MIEIITEISVYLIVAILLGFIFGWFVSRASWQEKFEKLEEEYLIQGKENCIEKENEMVKREVVEILKHKHEKEMEAFLIERNQIIKNYKELLLKIEELKPQ